MPGRGLPGSSRGRGAWCITAAPATGSAFSASRQNTTWSPSCTRGSAARSSGHTNTGPATASRGNPSGSGPAMVSTRATSRPRSGPGWANGAVAASRTFPSGPTVQLSQHRSALPRPGLRERGFRLPETSALFSTRWLISDCRSNTERARSARFPPGDNVENIPLPATAPASGWTPAGSATDRT